MGTSIYANYKNAPELSGGARIMLTFREAVALHFDKEFGEHYATLIKCIGDNQLIKAWDAKALMILSDKRFKDEDIDIIDFLYMDDGYGKIKHTTCLKVYNLLKDHKSNRHLRYRFYSNNDWEDLKELLLGCYKHRAYLRWR